MSLPQEELDELLASIEPPVPGMVGESYSDGLQGAPPVASETGPAKPPVATPTPGYSPRQQPSDGSALLQPSSTNPSLSASSSSPRLLLPSIATSRPSSASTPARAVVMSSSESTSDIDALAASLESEGILPSEREAGQAANDDKFTALPPLLLTSPRSQSMSTVTFEVDMPAQEHCHHQGCATIIQKQATEVRIRSSDSPRASSSQSPRGTPQGVTPLSKTISPSRRRLTIGSHEVSPHALERLGVNTDILKKEKGMKKLGISDVDIQRSEEIRRYSGVPQHLSPVTKVEFMFGFTKEQLLRVKAINRLGTSEEEVMDEYSRRVSLLGEVHDTATAVHSR